MSRLFIKIRKKYYQALEKSDVKGESTDFIEFSLEMIVNTLKEFSGEILSAKPSANDRIEMAVEHFSQRSFSRKDYMLLHKEISTATASRDLAQAVLNGVLEVKGEKSRAKYRLRNEKRISSDQAGAFIFADH